MAMTLSVVRFEWCHAFLAWEVQANGPNGRCCIRSRSCSGGWSGDV